MPKTKTPTSTSLPLIPKNRVCANCIDAPATHWGAIRRRMYLLCEACAGLAKSPGGPQPPDPSPEIWRGIRGRTKPTPTMEDQELNEQRSKPMASEVLAGRSILDADFVDNLELW